MSLFRHGVSAVRIAGGGKRGPDKDLAGLRALEFLVFLACLVLFFVLAAAPAGYFILSKSSFSDLRMSFS